MNTLNHKRLLLKISGELLRGDSPFGIDGTACHRTAEALQRIHNQGIELAVVIGGGNFFRGSALSTLGMARTPADQIGMLATMMNGIALQQALQSIDCSATVMSAFDCPRFAESYNWHKAHSALEQGDILIFVGGTGNPYFTTDTTAAMRASEIGASLFLKATKVNGVYNKDPKKFPDAIRYETITFTEILTKQLGIIDSTAASLCISNHIPLYVFNMEQLFHHSIEQILHDNQNGTLVSEEIK